MLDTRPADYEFSVTEISQTIKNLVETAFNKVKIRGEISSCKRADSGHYYLALKDENTKIDAVVWKGVAANLKTKPEDGLEVIITGRITTFPGKSSYQVVIEQMEVAGLGALLKLLEERKKKFEAEGLFDQKYKKKIPYLPQTIGVITSQSGAVIRDIIHRISDRFPSHILLWPTPVQGEGAAEKIAAAIEGFNSLPKKETKSQLEEKYQVEFGFSEADGSKTRSTEAECTQLVHEHSSTGFCNQMPNKTKLYKPDVLIIARGGGSLEDLWCFNEEVVIRAVFKSQIPIISAVGHETDTMLIDYVSDLRAPTPTGAAEFAVPVKAELEASLATTQSRMKSSINRYFEIRKNKLEGLSRGIPNLSKILLEAEQKLDDKLERLKLSFKNLLQNKHNYLEKIPLKPFYILNIFEKKKDYLNNLSARLDSLSIENVLKRGFAWVKDEKQKTIYNLEQAKRANNLEINFYDGKIKTYPKKPSPQLDLFDSAD